MSNEQASSYNSRIAVAYPEVGERHLLIRVGACQLNITPSESDDWVTGSYSDPTKQLPLNVVQQGGTTTITQLNRIEPLNVSFKGIPQFQLALGTTRPYALTIETGASNCEIELGGLPLSSLVIRQGAGACDVNFSAPNPHPLSLIEIGAGAAGLDMKNLANANFAEMKVAGGAAGYSFDFGGTLRRDAQVMITTGICAVDLFIPSRTASHVYTGAMLGLVDAGDGFMRRDGAYWTQAALDGGTPLLTVRVSVALGGLDLRVTND